jgi:eukaryotic-like serine/threonine-protein kinase
MGLLVEGQKIRGTYEVERMLGEGAFAEVYRVRHRFLGRQAMKVFKMVGQDLRETEEMLGEALMLTHIGHPNIIRVYDANTTETSHGVCSYFTMDYVAGGSLEQFWRSHGVRFVPVATAVEVLRQTCRGLVVAHSERPPIIHRDIKPQNILVGYDVAGLRVRISDFGLAKRVNPLTLLASARGTRSFKAPEALRNPGQDSCAGDVWALGTTLYLLLTDRLPYEDPEELAEAGSPAAGRPPTPPSRLNALVDPDLDEIVLRALALEPRERFPSAVEMLAALDRSESAARGVPPSSKDEIGKSSEKSALGAHTTADEQAAAKMATTAVELSRQAGRLAEAADLLEEAFNLSPRLRERYEYRLQLWRRGISN